MERPLALVLVSAVLLMGWSGGPLKDLNKNKMLSLVNAARTKGCNCGPKYFPPAPPLVWNDLLEQSAKTHSASMEAKGFFSHTGADGSEVADRLSRAGYKWTSYGENIGAGFSTEELAVASWLKSPGHCKNIMNPQFTDFGAARSGDYWTQVFGNQK